MLFRFDSVTKSYGAHEVLRDASFQINPGDHVGLVGRNGAGKTTLFKLLLGLEEPDEGRVETMRGLRVGLLEQQVGVVHEGTVREATLRVFSALHEIEDRMRALEHDMSEASGDQLDAILGVYSDLQHEFEDKGGFTMAARAESVLLGLGFSRDDLDLQAATLSGGQRARLALARLLLEEPDVLLLDEPTNHLDVRAVEWLEEFLAAYGSAYVVISHDRFLLDRTATRIVAVENGRTATYAGNYTAYLVEREQRRLLAEKRYREQQELIERTEEFIRRNLAGQKTKQAKSRRNMLERMDRVERPDGDRGSASFSLGSASRTGREVLKTDELAIGFPGVTLASDLTFTVERGDRLGVIGGNGTGKTTLLRTLLSEVDVLAGEFEWGHNVSLAYYDQHLSDLDPKNEVIEEMRRALPGQDDPGVRAYLARFLFSGDDVFKRVSALSGGERSRLSLAKLISGGGNTLLLDEPTNHLDIPSREALEAALEEFSGTLLIVSHDRYFLDRICNRLLHLEEGAGAIFEGTYSEWAEERTARQAEERAARVAPTQRGAPPPRPKRDRGRPVADLEAEIADVESEISDLETTMAKPEIASDHVKLAPLTDAHARAAARLEALLAEWESVASTEQ
jgi:ATP-binding cassette subfamily F protein 3